MSDFKFTTFVPTAVEHRFKGGDTIKLRRYSAPRVVVQVEHSTEPVYVLRDGGRPRVAYVDEHYLLAQAAGEPFKLGEVVRSARTHIQGTITEVWRGSDGRVLYSVNWDDGGFGSGYPASQLRHAQEYPTFTDLADRMTFTVSFNRPRRSSFGHPLPPMTDLEVAQWFARTIEGSIPGGAQRAEVLIERNQS